MRVKSRFLVWSLALVAVGCGMKKKKEEETTSLPKIDFTFPNSATASLSDAELAQAADSGTNVLNEWSKRMDNAVGYINKTLEKLNGEKIQKAGSVSFKNASGQTIKVTVAAYTADSTYSQEGLVCVDASPMLLIRWNDDSSKVYALKDFAVEPYTATYKSTMKTELTYEKSTTSTITAQSYGTPWSVPTDVSADTTNGGTFLGETVKVSKDANSIFTIVGLNAWEAAARTAANKADAFVGDAYLTGSLSADNTGKFLAWRKFNTICGTTTFTESSTGNPGWCFVGTVTSTGSATYSVQAADIAAQWADSTLKPLGVAKATSVKVVEFPSSVSCN